MSIQMWLAMSVAFNVILALRLYQKYRWQKYIKAQMHAALKMAKKTSDSVRFVRFEPWKEECIQNATDGIDALFGIIFGMVHPEIEVFVSLEDAPVLPPPVEPDPSTVPESNGSEESDDEGEEWKRA